MKQNPSLTISAFLTLVLSLVHITQDTMVAKEGVDPSGVAIIITILVVYLFGVTELAGRRAGYVIALLGGLGAAYMPFLHSMGPIGVAKGFWFILVLFAMGASGIYSALLAGAELWRSLRS